MPSRTLAGSLALKGDWDLGEDNWKDENDLNLLKLSVVVQGRALSLVSATPGSPTEGDIHLFSDTHPTEAGKIAVYDEATWKYITPAKGWQMWDVASDFLREFNGTTWLEVTSGGGSSSKYRVGFFMTNVPEANEVLMMHVFTKAVTFADEFAGAQGLVVTNPSATFTLTVKKITAAHVTTTVGTISVSTSGVSTFATSGTTVSFDPGDAMTVTAQAGVDATFANAAFTFEED